MSICYDGQKFGEDRIRKKKESKSVCGHNIMDKSIHQNLVHGINYIFDYSSL